MLLAIKKFFAVKKHQMLLIIDMIVNYISNIYSNICLFFHNLYVRYLKWKTFRLINKTSKAVYKLMPILGKDPNYVAPTPPPPAPSVRAPEEPKRKVLQYHYVPSWVAESFRNPSKHPLYYGSVATSVPEPPIACSQEPTVNFESDIQSELSPTILADEEITLAQHNEGHNAD